MLVLTLLALLLQAESPSALHRAGVAAYREHAYARAAEMLRQAAAGEVPESADYRDSVLLLGQSLYLSSNAAEAIPWLEKASASSVRVPEVLFMLGNSYLRARQFPKAAEAFARLYQFPVGSAASHLITAQMMMKQEMEEDAQGELRQALALDAKLPEAHFILGEIAIYRGDLEKAKQELLQEIAINPGFAMAYYRLGDAFSRREQWEQAIPLLQKSILLNSLFSGPYILLGKAYLKTGALPDAEGILRQAIQMDPQNSSAYYLLGQTLTKANRVVEAKSMLERSQQLREAQHR
jgi:tetratricopeptide (TPR) repeat protein